MRMSWHVCLIAALCASSTVASASLRDGLISVWTFDDETANDPVSGNDGVLRGGVQFSAGKFGLAVDLNGTDAVVEVPHDASMDPMANALTAAAWAFVRSPSEFVGILWKGKQVGWAPGFLFEITVHVHNQPNTWAWGVSTDSTEGWFHSRDDYLGQWVHVAQIADGQNIQAFFNGEPADVFESWSGGGGTGPLALAAPYNLWSDYPLWIGRSQGYRITWTTRLTLTAWLMRRPSGRALSPRSNSKRSCRGYRTCPQRLSPKAS